jgi:hypothetical protein
MNTVLIKDEYFSAKNLDEYKEVKIREINFKSDVLKQAIYNTPSQGVSFSAITNDVRAVDTNAAALIANVNTATTQEEVDAIIDNR